VRAPSPLVPTEAAPLDQAPLTRSAVLLEQATIVSPEAPSLGDGEPTRCVLEVAGGARLATLTELPGYAPSAGDRVLVALAGDHAYVLGVLVAARPLAVSAPSGASAALVGGAIELRDARGRLVVRHTGEATEVHAATRDLVLAAPSGNVVVRAAGDVVMEAGRDLMQSAARAAVVQAAGASRLELGAREAAVEAPTVRVAAGFAKLVAKAAEAWADSLESTAKTTVHRAERYEVAAERLVETAREAVRDVRELFEERLGRARTIVREASTLRAERVQVVAEREVTVDGEHIHLG